MIPAPAPKIVATLRLADRLSLPDYAHRRPGTDISTEAGQRLMSNLLTGCFHPGSMPRLWKRKEEHSATPTAATPTTATLASSRTATGSSVATTTSPASTLSSDDGKWITNVPMRGGMNEWKLASVLENSFAPEEYKISVRLALGRVKLPCCSIARNLVASRDMTVTTSSVPANLVTDASSVLQSVNTETPAAFRTRSVDVKSRRNECCDGLCSFGRRRLCCHDSIKSW